MRAHLCWPRNPRIELNAWAWIILPPSALYLDVFFVFAFFSYFSWSCDFTFLLSNTAKKCTVCSPVFNYLSVNFFVFVWWGGVAGWREVHTMVSMKYVVCVFMNASCNIKRSYTRNRLRSRAALTQKPAVVRSTIGGVPCTVEQSSSFSVRCGIPSLPQYTVSLWRA